MPIIRSIADLFRAGAVSTAEQFVRGLMRAATLYDALENRFGSLLEASQDVVSLFGDRVRQAAIPAAQVQLGRPVNASLIPDWNAYPSPGEFIHTGLARINANTASGTEVFHTHVPFNFPALQVFNYQQIIDRIRRSVPDAPADIAWRYLADIERLEQKIEYHIARGGVLDFEAELYSIFHGA